MGIGRSRGAGGYELAVRRETRGQVGVAKYLKKDGKDMMEATWKPHEKHGRLTMQSDLPDSVYLSAPRSQ